MARLTIARLLLLLVCCLLAGSVAAKKTVQIGFLEPGPNHRHAELRQHFREVLPSLVPDSIEVVNSPDGFGSGQWLRDSARAEARRLADNGDLDLIVAVGPWSVEDLIDVGYTKPIVAMYRFDPKAEGLIDDYGIPRYENLTVRVIPNRMRQDMALIAELQRPKKLGVLLYPSNDESDQLEAACRTAANLYGMEIVTASAIDKDGSYAFFAAKSKLPDDIDAIYTGPLWDFDSDKAAEFFRQCLNQNHPVYCSSNEYPVMRGAVLGTRTEPASSVAYYHAWKAAQIITGTTPAALPTQMDESMPPALNRYVAQQMGLEVSADAWLRYLVVEGPPSEDAEVLTLPDAVMLGRTLNPELQAKSAARERVQQRSSGANSSLMPDVTLRGEYRYVDDNTIHNDPRFTNSQADIRLSLEKTLLESGGPRKSLGTRTSFTGRDGLELLHRNYEQTVTTAYLDHIEALATRDIVRGWNSRVQAQLHLSQMKYKLGVAAVREQYLWERVLLNSLDQLNKAELNIKLTRSRLNELLGRPGDYPIALSHALFTAQDAGEIYGALAPMLSGNDPSLQAALLDRAMSYLSSGEESKSNPRDSHVSAAYKWYIPKLGVKADIGWSTLWEDYPGFEEEHVTWSVGTFAEFPLFGKKARRSKQGRNDVMARDASFALDSRRLKTRNDVQLELEQAHTTGLSFLLRFDATKSSDQYLRETRLAYLTDEQSAEITERAFADDEMALVNSVRAQFDFFKALARLAFLAGHSVNDSGLLPQEFIFQVAREARNQKP